MARQRGSKASVRMYEQTAIETPATGPANGLLLPIIDTDLRLTQDLVESRVLTGNRNPAEPAPNEKSVEGSMTVQPDVRAFGFLLKHLFGGVATQAGVPSAGLNTHTFTVSDLPPGLTIERFLPQVPAAFRSYGCRINTMSMDIGSGGLLEASFGVMGIDEVDPIPTTPLDATPTTYAFQGFRLPSVTLSEGGTATTIATRFSLEISNELEGIRTIGNQGRYADLMEGLFRATGSLSVLFDNLTLYNKAKNQTSSSLVLTFPSVATPAGQSLQLLFDEVKYALSSPGIPGPGGVIAELNWQAFVATGTSAAKAILINDVASYASIT